MSQGPQGQYFSLRAAKEMLREKHLNIYVCLSLPRAAEMSGMAGGVSLRYICVYVCVCVRVAMVCSQREEPAVTCLKSDEECLCARAISCLSSETPCVLPKG